MRLSYELGSIKLIYNCDYPLEPNGLSLLFSKKSETCYNFDIDVVVLLKGQDGRVRQRDFIFFNNLSNDSGTAMIYGDCLSGCAKCGVESVGLNLSEIPAYITSISVIGNIYDAQKRNQHFGETSDHEITLMKLSKFGDCTGKVIACEKVTGDFNRCSMIHLCEFARCDDGWEYSVLAEKMDMSLKDLHESVVIQNQ